MLIKEDLVYHGGKRFGAVYNNLIFVATINGVKCVWPLTGSAFPEGVAAELELRNISLVANYRPESRSLYLAAHGQVKEKLLESGASPDGCHTSGLRCWTRIKVRGGVEGLNGSIRELTQACREMVQGKASQKGKARMRKGYRLRNVDDLIRLMSKIAESTEEFIPRLRECLSKAAEDSSGAETAGSALSSTEMLKRYIAGGNEQPVGH